jgi:hypothetical protein
MDESILNIAIFLSATFAAALAIGLAGFAFGLVAAAVWLHAFADSDSDHRIAVRIRGHAALLKIMEESTSCTSLGLVPSFY